MIRRARPGDVPAILTLIRELARYEREPDAVDNDETRLQQSLFSPDPAVFAHVVEDEGAVVGTAIWFVNYSTWTGRHGIYLEDLVVSSGQRRSGHGRALLAELAGICRKRGYARLEWSVLDWNTPAHGFYAAVGAEPMTGWTVNRLSGAALDSLGTESSPA